MKLCRDCRHARWVDFMDNEERVHEPYRCMGIMIDPVTGAKKELGSLCKSVNINGQCVQWETRQVYNTNVCETLPIKYLGDMEV